MLYEVSTGARLPCASSYKLGTRRGCGHSGRSLDRPSAVLRFDNVLKILLQKLQTGCIGNSAVTTTVVN